MSEKRYKYLGIAYAPDSREEKVVEAFKVYVLRKYGTLARGHLSREAIKALEFYLEHAERGAEQESW